jgi:hypothetical protein
VVSEDRYIVFSDQQIISHLERTQSPCANHPCQSGKCFELNDPAAPHVCLCPNGQFGLNCRTSSFDTFEYSGLTSTSRIFTTPRTTTSTTTTTRSPDTCNPLEHRSCMNGGRCLAATHRYRCMCQPGYTGIHCEMST